MAGAAASASGDAWSMPCTFAQRTITMAWLTCGSSFRRLSVRERVDPAREGRDRDAKVEDISARFVYAMRAVLARSPRTV